LQFDRGPATPGYYLPQPPDVEDLVLEDQRYSKSGTNWLHYVVATNNSYIAIFSGTSAPNPAPDGSSEAWRIQQEDGIAFVDVYRVSDSKRLASARFSYAIWGAESIRKAFWLNSTKLVIPLDGALEGQTLIGFFPPEADQKQLLRPVRPAILKSTAVSSCLQEPVMRLLGFRDEGIDNDQNGTFEAIRVSAQIDVSQPGSYRYTMVLMDQAGRKLEHQGTQRLTNGIQQFEGVFQEEDWEQGGDEGAYQIQEIRVQQDADERNFPFILRPRQRSLTSAYPSAVLDQGSSYYLLDSLKGVSLDANTIELSVGLFSREGGRCLLHPSLFDASLMTAWQGTCNLALQRGMNTIQCQFRRVGSADPLPNGPYSITGLSPTCSDHDGNQPRLVLPKLSTSP
jgi:hypothetical protein